MRKTSLKSIAIFLVFLLLLPEISVPSEKALKTFYKNAVNSYEKGDYKEAVVQLNSCLELVPSDKPVFKSKLLLILAASYSKLGNVEKSEQTLNLLKQHIKKKRLGGIPSIYLTDSDQMVVELNPSRLAGYKNVFKDNKYRVRRLIEKKGVRKTKKSEKLAVKIIGGVIIAIIIAIAIFKKKKSELEPEEPYREVEWVTIPAGEFWMGDDKNIGEPCERPLHKVYLDEYAISKYEVTYEQYDKFCDETDREKPSNEIYYNKYVGRGKFPVVNIGWFDAKAYCDWLSQKLGKNIHLPTEAQWEKAARGTDKRTYPWGNQPPTFTLTNWNTLDVSNKPQPVGNHPEGKSPYGVFDMAGNVWEYCSDIFDENYYSISPYKNPKGPQNGSWNTIRGGSFRRKEGPVRSSFRRSNTVGNERGSIGFRPVME
ncbi:MAG: formylglycine-generating enzyme family protein [Acidobacteriota bacterium]